ncbi:hypothetical protein C8035_v004078 [Colletotrichum spinosum]|uniref:Uncharacterized protein n=1 Tax=Colletotrichum spinosum TaxID=1347390 RepID=A0A4R8QVL6_9PEZI|nr:hypothetical protein C8035_v004078 [Colletotrichum spinosum]
MNPQKRESAISTTRVVVGVSKVEGVVFSVCLGAMRATTEGNELQDLLAVKWEVMEGMRADALVVSTLAGESEGNRGGYGDDACGARICVLDAATTTGCVIKKKRRVFSMSPEAVDKSVTLPASCFLKTARPSGGFENESSVALIEVPSDSGVHLRDSADVHRNLLFLKDEKHF